MEKAIAKIKAMSDQTLMQVWAALVDYDPKEFYDETQNITMDDWAHLVNAERNNRGLPMH